MPKIPFPMIGAALGVYEELGNQTNEQYTTQRVALFDLAQYYFTESRVDEVWRAC
jgi:hypothetical protein